MKQNWFKNGIWPCKLRLAMIIVAVLALTLLSAPPLFAKKAVSEKLKEQDKKGQIESSTPDISPKHASPKDNQPAVEKKSVKPKQNQIQPASAYRDKGKQIKWQVVCSGGACASSSPQYYLGGQVGYHLCGTVGQLSVGPGSSESYSLNSGFWQEFLQEYLRGDVNKDGVINVIDIVFLINYLFNEYSPPDPLWLGDANSDGKVDVVDIVFLINYVFGEGPPPGC